MTDCFDAYVTAPPDAQGQAPPVPEGLTGAVLFGPEAKPRCEEFSRWVPGRVWRHAETLERIAGESHATFPSRSADVVDLELAEDELVDWLRTPDEWWPLASALRASGRFLRLRLPPGLTAVPGAKHVIKKYSNVLFWLDPFLHGLVNGWQAQVRLAELPNVILTTLGLLPEDLAVDAADGTPVRLDARKFTSRRTAEWTVETAQEALRFVRGEVGAGVLLFAGGADWDDLDAPPQRAFRRWLAECPEFDAEERKLVMLENARKFFRVSEADKALPGL